MSTPVVYVHIGAPKTGTTYLQDRLGRNARRLAEHDVHVPRLNPITTPAMSHFRGALDLLDEDWGGTPGHADGAWPKLARKIRRSSGSVIISHEILAPAPPAKIARLMNDLEGCEVHVVYSARDLARQLPAAWQESVKQGRTWRFRRFLDMAESGKPWFMRAFDLPTVLGNWSRTLPAGAGARGHRAAVRCRPRRAVAALLPGLRLRPGLGAARQRARQRLARHRRDRAAAPAQPRHQAPHPRRAGARRHAPAHARLRSARAAASPARWSCRRPGCRGPRSRPSAGSSG